MNLSGTIVGYDPGGNGAHGLAVVSYTSGEISRFHISTHQTVESAISVVSSIKDLVALGVDTLTCWSTGPSGWRPADRWLKKEYPQITNSIASANSLFGAMGLNGMSMLIKIREIYPGVHISETHPKVLYFERMQSKYDYAAYRDKMDTCLSKLFGLSIATNNEHEWDAAISVYAVKCGMLGFWRNNLHSLEKKNDESLIEPAGPTSYWWPR